MYREGKLNEGKGLGQNQRKHDFVTNITTQTDSKIVEDINGIQKEKKSEKTSHDANRSNKRTNKDIPRTDDNLAIRSTKTKEYTNTHDKKNNIEHPPDYTNKSIESENESGVDENIDKITSAIIDTYLKPGDEEPQEMMAFCLLWDFAGRKDFYATHQIFMPKSAVYILVTDSLDSSTVENMSDESGSTFLKL